MHEIETELKKALKFKGKYEDRQELLTAILLAMDDRNRFTDKDYDALTDEAVQWFEAAVKAKDVGDELPDFDGDFESEEESEAEETAEFEEAEDASEEPDTAADVNDGGDEVDEEDENEAEAPVETTEYENGSVEEDQHSEDDFAADTGTGATGSEDSEESVGEETEEQTLQKAKKIAKQTPKPTVKKAVQKGTFPEPDYEKINAGDKNRFGMVKGTKTDEAIKMYLKGASGKDIYDRLGGRYYNVLKKLAAEGHKVEKVGAIFTLTHKDDKAKKKAK